jgi:ABC-type Fe3+ transport system substrate-binding protein
MKFHARFVQTLATAALAAVVLSLLAACGSDPTPTPRPTATPVPVATPTEVMDEAAMMMMKFEEEWAALAAGAAEEGQLVIAAGGSGARDSRPVWDVFQEKYDVEVLITTGTSNEVLQRLLGEQAANRYEVDLFMMDILKQNDVIKANGLQPLEPLFIHPEVTDLSLWYNNQYLWADAERTYVIGYAATLNRDSIVTAGYNTDRVSEEDVARITVDKDFIAPWFVEKFAGTVLMMAPPPYSTAGGGAYYTVVKHPSLGREFLDEFMTSMEPDWETDNRRACDVMTTGKYSWIFFGSNVVSCLDDLGGDGLPVAEFEMEAGPNQQPFLSGGSSAMQFSAPINPPHPNAQQLAINWYLSVEGQTANNELASVREGRFPRPSLRNDVPPGKTDPDQRREPGVIYELCIECNPEEHIEAIEIYAFAQGVYEKIVGIR